jgi:hypothetical protein
MTMNVANRSGAIFGPTAGIARNMQADLQTPPVLLRKGNDDE